MCVAADLFADTLSADTTVTASTSHHVHSPAGANLGIATLVADTFGYERIEMRFDMTTAASGNFLYRWI